MILGADLNTWMGPHEPAVRRLRDAFPSTPDEPARNTFRGGLTLDYLFFRLPSGLHPHVTRAASRYGSDHFPLIALLQPTCRWLKLDCTTPEGAAGSCSLRGNRKVLPLHNLPALQDKYSHPAPARLQRD